MNYVFRVLILTAIFVAVIYIFMFRRRRQRRQDMDFDSVREYHETYLSDHSDARNKSGYTRYITKYNSNEDYREK